MEYCTFVVECIVHDINKDEQAREQKQEAALDEQEKHFDEYVHRLRTDPEFQRSEQEKSEIPLLTHDRIEAIFGVMKQIRRQEKQKKMFNLY